MYILINTAYFHFYPWEIHCSSSQKWFLICENRTIITFILFVIHYLFISDKKNKIRSCFIHISRFSEWGLGMCNFESNVKEETIPSGNSVKNFKK